MGRARDFIINTAIMTVTSLLLQGISMAFNVYISNKIVIWSREITGE